MSSLPSLRARRSFPALHAVVLLAALCSPAAWAQETAPPQEPLLPWTPPPSQEVPPPVGPVLPPAARPAPLEASNLEVVSGRLDVGALLDEEEEKVHVGVVVAAPDDPAMAPLSTSLENAVVAAVKSHRRVARVVGHRTPGKAGMADHALGAQVAQLLDVDRVVIVHVGTVQADGVPLVALVLTADNGQGLARMEAPGLLRARVVAPPPPPRADPRDTPEPPRDAARAPRARAAPPAPLDELDDEADEDALDDDVDGPPAASTPPRDAAGAREEFKQRALTLKRVRGADGRRELALFRGGRALTAEEMEALAVPDAEPPSDRSAGVRKLLGAALLPTPLLAGLVCGALGWGSCLLGCVGCYAAETATTGNAQTILEGIIVGVVCGSVCGSVPGLVSAIIGAVAGLLGTVGGGGLLAWEFMKPAPEHPYKAFAHRHNSALARELGLRKSALPDRYFPLRKGK